MKWLIGMIMLFLVALAACTPAPTGKVIAPENIELGVLLSQTGPGAPYGQDQLEGIRLAVSELNKVRYNDIELRVQDTATNQNNAVTGMHQLLSTSKPVAIIGATASSSTLAVAPIAQQEKVVLMTPSSSNPDISKSGEYVFRMYPSDALQAEKIAQKIVEMNIQKVNVLYRNNDYGKGLLEAFKKTFEGQITGDIAYSPGQKDYASHLLKMKQNNDPVLIIGATSEYINILNQMKQLDITVQIFATESFNDKQILDHADANGVIFTVPQTVSFVGTDFANAYEDLYGKQPSIFAAYAYDSVYAINKALSKDGHLHQNLGKLSFQGVTGLISFDAGGDLQVPTMGFYRVKNNTYVEI